MRLVILAIANSPVAAEDQWLDPQQDSLLLSVLCSARERFACQHGLGVGGRTTTCLQAMLALGRLAIALAVFQQVSRMAKAGGATTIDAPLPTFNFFCLHVVHARAVLSPSRARLGARKLAICSEDYYIVVAT